MFSIGVFNAEQLSVKVGVITPTQTVVQLNHSAGGDVVLYFQSGTDALMFANRLLSAIQQENAFQSILHKARHPLP